MKSPSKGRPLLESRRWSERGVGERIHWAKKAGHKGEVAHFTFTAHKAKQMRERFSSSLPLYLFVRRTERREGMNKVVNCQLLPGLTKILVSSLITFISRLHVVLCDSLSNQTFGKSMDTSVLCCPRRGCVLKVWNCRSIRKTRTADDGWRPPDGAELAGLQLSIQLGKVAEWNHHQSRKQIVCL